MEKIKNIVREHKTEAISAVIVLICIIVAVFILCNKSEEKKAPEVKTLTATTPAEIQRVMPGVSSSEAKDITRVIERTTIEKAPTHEYFTYSQAAADKTAQEYAKADHADVLIKQTDVVPVINSDNAKQPAAQVIENKYYAVQTERKHAISVGAAAVDAKAYATLSYRNRRTTVTAMYNPVTHEAGAAVSYEIAKW